METASVTTERSQFLNYDEAVKVNSTLFDHTDNGTTHYATRLRGSTNEQYRLAKSLSIMPGDTIRIEVFAKYVDPNSGNWQQVLSDLMTSIANGTAPAGTVVDGGLAGSIGNTAFPYGGLLEKTSGGTPPKAFVNYIMFDRDVNPIFDPEQTNFIQVSELARETGTNSDHERLYVQVIAKQAGLMYIYLSNDNVALGGSAVEVFFDDFRVEHVKSPVIQMDDYYPFGLTFNSYQRENRLMNNFKFQGQEHINDLNLDWDAFKWRNHMPDIGRFFNVDPLAESFYYNSPYAFSENKVTNHIELEGLEAYPAQQALNQEVKKVENAVVSVVNTVTEGVSDALGWVSDKLQFMKDVPREEPGGQQKGIGINIYDKDAGPDNKYAPSPDPNAKNYDMEKSLLDALGAAGESLKSPSPEDIGQRFENVANTMEKTNGAIDAAKNIGENGKVELDTVYTTGNVDKDGSIYNSYYVIKNQKDTVDNRHYTDAPKKN